ncbi:hypothetical protein [Ferrovibrio sp.]|uniref:hypothetical protein n=1 Tax=Ferrovibrio sp. TaxID=1917215 RepID=UPI000CC31CBA|nr:hypothetical protein [Ferrovibrio sp.]PJI40395.1 MAG: hypothetical protein CTR53_10315 [Ferrovibrio sp.]
MTFLSKLNIVKNAPQELKGKLEGIALHRKQLIEKLEEQGKMFSALIIESKPEYKRIRNKKGGGTKEQKVSPWYYNVAGMFYLAPKMGRTEIDLGGRVGAAKDAFLPALNNLVEAVRAGEIDKQITDAHTKDSATRGKKPAAAAGGDSKKKK